MESAAKLVSWRKRKRPLFLFEMRCIVESIDTLGVYSEMKYADYL